MIVLRDQPKRASRPPSTPLAMSWLGKKNIAYRKEKNPIVSSVSTTKRAVHAIRLR